MQQKIEDNLAKLVSIPSVSTNPTARHAIIEHVKSQLDGLGLFIYHDTRTNPWLVATTQDTKTPDILLAAHLDVVPAPNEMFTMTKKDDKLFGRGVYDMKFAASCYIELFKAHAAELADMNIGILFTTDEETSSGSIASILDWGLRPDIILLPDGGDNWAIEKRAKGIYGFELTAHGKAAHGSRPWEGDNALHSLLDVAQSLRIQYPSNNPVDATLSINKIASGDAINQVPHQATVGGDFRSFDPQDIANIRTLVADLAKLRGLSLRILNDSDPLVFDADDNPHVQRFIQTIQDITGHDVKYCDSYGASDARYFATYDVPSIVVQPQGGGRHSHDEWMMTSDLEKFYRLIERWVFATTV